MTGDILFLNGTSSSGKSTLAKALQSELEEPYLHTGIDHFIQALPNHVVQIRDVEPDVVPQDKLAVVVFQNHQMISIHSGKLNRQLRTGLYHAVAGLAESGVNVIVDDLLFEPWMVETAVSILSPYSPLFVRVFCPLPVAKSYEIKRGDRAIGGAALFYDAVYGIPQFDIEVNTAEHDPESCAKFIHAAIKQNQPRTAFQDLQQPTSTHSST